MLLFRPSGRRLGSGALAFRAVSSMSLMCFRASSGVAVGSTGGLGEGLGALLFVHEPSSSLWKPFSIASVSSWARVSAVIGGGSGRAGGSCSALKAASSSGVHGLSDSRSSFFCFCRRICEAVGCGH